MDDPTVRPAETGDVADVRRIARESWHAAYDDIVGPDAVESVVSEWYDLNHLRRSVERDDGVFLVAETEADGETRTSEDGTDAEVVGFGIVFIVSAIVAINLNDRDISSVRVHLMQPFSLSEGDGLRP